jgi:hypothetical protein
MSPTSKKSVDHASLLCCNDTHFSARLRLNAEGVEPAFGSLVRRGEPLCNRASLVSLVTVLPAGVCLRVRRHRLFGAAWGASARFDGLRRWGRERLACRAGNPETHIARSAQRRHQPAQQRQRRTQPHQNRKRLVVDLQRNHPARRGLRACSEPSPTGTAPAADSHPSARPESALRRATRRESARRPLPSPRGTAPTSTGCFQSGWLTRALAIARKPSAPIAPPVSKAEKLDRVALHRALFALACSLSVSGLTSICGGAKNDTYKS